jgi:NAD(P)-dependent dehydrogenase (short-subunit alcohol dehydrogenase family)
MSATSPRGRGLGEHALLFAAEGAGRRNDLGSDMHGRGAPKQRQEVIEEIKDGWRAVVNGDNVADWDGAARLVQTAIDTFGGLHVLVNNAGILRDRVIINMTEAEWDAVIQVHLKGHFCPTRHAATYWREQTKAGKNVNAALVHTTSTSGLFSNPGQANYDGEVGHRDVPAGAPRSHPLWRAIELIVARNAVTEATPDSVTW